MRMNQNVSVVDVPEADPQAEIERMMEFLDDEYEDVDFVKPCTCPDPPVLTQTYHYTSNARSNLFKLFYIAW